MNSIKNILFVAALLFTSSGLYAQPSIDYSVQTWAEIESSPLKITIHWLAVNGADNYTIYKKEKTETSWGMALATLDAAITFFEDSDLEEGISYEYKIEKMGNVPAFGYINAGIEIAPVHYRGNLLLLVDSLFTDGLAAEIAQLTADFIGDGWQVFREEVSREKTAIEIKELITEVYNTQANNLDVVFCLGHIPVPYSGNYAPDGHSNNHQGAWPADGYYGDIDGAWTDQSANNTTASQERNHNVPGDGKFDQLYFASELEMQVGRVDFANMPAFSLSEEELLRQYLNKSHAFKTGQTEVKKQAIIDDNFGGFSGEAFAGSAWKSFAPLLHPDNVKAGDYRTSMDTASYMWSYGCGGGSYASCSGVGTTANFAGDSLQGIFSCLFGSYFGDWDSQNNLIRASLAQGTILTNCWSGRPHWYFHHMGLGENIGYSTKVSMNNKGTFYNTPLSFLGNMISMGLMGDPTLRMQILAPASDFTAVYDDLNIELNWTASTDPEAGYYIYRSDQYNSHYDLLTEEAVFATSYIDECIEVSATYHYMLRATKLERTPSGSFYNLSQGVFAEEEAEVNFSEAGFNSTLVSGLLTTENISVYANTWHWDFGDGTTSDEFEPTHNYLTSGDYELSLIASNSCFQDTTATIASVIISGINDFIVEAGIRVAPNPGRDWFRIYSGEALSGARIYVYDSFGKMVKNVVWEDGAESVLVSLELLPEGIYFMEVRDGAKVGIVRVVRVE